MGFWGDVGQAVLFPFGRPEPEWRPVRPEDAWLAVDLVPGGRVASVGRAAVRVGAKVGLAGVLRKVGKGTVKFLRTGPGKILAYGGAGTAATLGVAYGAEQAGERGGRGIEEFTRQASEGFEDALRNLGEGTAQGLRELGAGIRDGAVGLGLGAVAVIGGYAVVKTVAKATSGRARKGK